MTHNKIQKYYNKTPYFYVNKCPDLSKILCSVGQNKGIARIETVRKILDRIQYYYMKGGLNLLDVVA